MIAGGTGITPMTQIMRQIIKDNNDKTEIKLIFGNVSIDDILLKDELQTMRSQNNNISVYFTLDKVKCQYINLFTFLPAPYFLFFYKFYKTYKHKNKKCK